MFVQRNGCLTHSRTSSIHLHRLYAVSRFTRTRLCDRSKQLFLEYLSGDAENPSLPSFSFRQFYITTRVGESKRLPRGHVHCNNNNNNNNRNNHTCCAAHENSLARHIHVYRVVCSTSKGRFSRVRTPWPPPLSIIWLITVVRVAFESRTFVQRRLHNTPYSPRVLYCCTLYRVRPSPSQTLRARFARLPITAMIEYSAHCCMHPYRYYGVCRGAWVLSGHTECLEKKNTCREIQCWRRDCFDSKLKLVGPPFVHNCVSVMNTSVFFCFFFSFSDTRRMTTSNHWN